MNWSKTKAFTTIRSTGEGVSINLAGRGPDGAVSDTEADEMEEHLRGLGYLE